VGEDVLKSALTFLICIVALLAILYFTERNFSPVFQGCIEKYYQTNTDASTNNDKTASISILITNIRCTGDFIDANATSITALATIIIAAFTGTLWIATSRQAQLTRDAFIADKRAFVFASGIQPFYEPDVATGHFNWRIGAVWHNSGDTPTRSLELYTDGFLSNVEIPSTFDFNYTDPAVPPGPGMIGPKVYSGGGQAPHMPGAALTPQDIVDMQGGRKFFYLWGWARYHDTLPGTPQHITRYCWRIMAIGNPIIFNPIVDPNGVRFFNVYERRGNCADDECQLQGLG